MLGDQLREVVKSVQDVPANLHRSGLEEGAEEPDEEAPWRKVSREQGIKR